MKTMHRKRQTMETNRVAVDISSMNELINNTIKALNSIMKLPVNGNYNIIIQAATVAKELQEVIQSNGIKMFELNNRIRGVQNELI